MTCSESEKTSGESIIILYVQINIHRFLRYFLYHVGEQGIVDRSKRRRQPRIGSSRFDPRTTACIGI